MQVENILRQYLYIQNVQVAVMFTLDTWNPTTHSETKKTPCISPLDKFRIDPNFFSSGLRSPLLCPLVHTLSKLQNQSTGPCPTSLAKCNPENRRKRSFETQNLCSILPCTPSLFPMPMKTIKGRFVSHSFSQHYRLVLSKLLNMHRLNMPNSCPFR